MERIRSRRSDTFQGKIAVVTDREDGKQWHLADRNWQRLFASAQDQALKMGFELENFSTRDYDTRGRRLSQILVARGIQGILVAPGLLQSRMDLEWENFSAVSVGHSLREPRLHRVCCNDFSTIQGACRRVLQIGYRRLGLYERIDQNEDTNRQNRAGFLLIQEDCIPQKNRIPAELVPAPHAQERFLKWLHAAKPDVVFAYRCEELAKWAAQAGCRCPDDLGFVELDHPAGLSAFAGVQHHMEFLGRAAVDLIIAQIQRNETGIPKIPADLTLEGYWRDGASVKSAVPPSHQPVSAGADFTSRRLAACLT